MADVIQQRRPIWHYAAVVLVLVAALDLSSPYLYLRGLQKSLNDRDTAELQEKINFPALQMSVKSQFKAKALQELQKEADGPFGQLGAMIGMGMVDTMVESMFTPDGLVAMLSTRSPDDASSDANAGARRANLTGLSVERTGFSTFELTGNATYQAPVMRFTRTGLSWQLSDIRLPENFGDELQADPEVGAEPDQGGL